MNTHLLSFFCNISSWRRLSLLLAPLPSMLIFIASNVTLSNLIRWLSFNPQIAEHLPAQKKAKTGWITLSPTKLYVRDETLFADALLDIYSQVTLFLFGTMASSSFNNFRNPNRSSNDDQNKDLKANIRESRWIQPEQWQSPEVQEKFGAVKELSPNSSSRSHSIPLLLFAGQHWVFRDLFHASAARHQSTEIRIGQTPRSARSQ